MYQFTQEDRSKGGKTTAQKYDMRERGQRGLEALARNHFDGDCKRAGETLYRIGLWRQDPARWNTAWQFPRDCPESLRTMVLDRWAASPDGLPF